MECKVRISALAIPCTAMAMPSCTVVTMEQVSGQSCGQAPRIWVGVVGGMGEADRLSKSLDYSSEAKVRSKRHSQRLSE